MKQATTQTKPSAPDYNEGKVFNHYRCEACGAITIAKHEDQGVTPFQIRCRATARCRGDAFSCFYRGPQDPAQVPHIVWYRPTPIDVDAEITKGIEQLRRQGELDGSNATQREQLHANMRRHYELGGCLMRGGLDG